MKSNDSLSFWLKLQAKRPTSFVKVLKSHKLLKHTLTFKDQSQRQTKATATYCEQDDQESSQYAKGPLD